MSRESILPSEEVIIAKSGVKTVVSTSHGMYGNGDGNTVKHSYGSIHVPKSNK
jgi:hypothetical protein